MTKKYTEEVIGLHGISNIFKLCHLPFLNYKDCYGALALEGSSGTGKTTIIQRLGMLNRLSTGEDYAIYSADKARYEDFIGCPIPNQDTREMDMYPMKNAVATKALVLIDEINRAEYCNQEKWMSLLSSRKIDGFDVACKYIYVAMNPVMSEDNDIYEGVQPLDKAVGERIYGLIRMIPFHELSVANQLNVLKSSVNQTRWEPTEEQVELHKSFLSACKEQYEKNKEKLFDSVGEYVYQIAKTIKEETKKATTVEARRAQFILLNILGVHALNSVYASSISLENSALEALELSFPGRLWEQAIPMPAIVQAHKACKKVLEAVMAVRKPAQKKINVTGLYSLIKDIREVVDQNPSKEAVTKIINDKLPDIATEPLNHYIYATAASKGLVFNDGSTAIKAQEYTRLEKIVKRIQENKEYIRARAAGELHLKNKSFPKKYEYPSYIQISMTSDQGDAIKRSYEGILDYEVGWYTQGIVDLAEVELYGGQDFLELSERLSTMEALFKNIAMKLANKNINWVDFEEVA